MDTLAQQEIYSKILFYIESHQGLVTTIFAGFSLIFTFVTVIFTGVLTFLNKRLADETKRMREKDTEPNIEVYIVPHEISSNFLDMVIKNSGGGPARDISWKLEYDEDNIEKKRIQILKMSLFSILHYIPSNEQFKFFFGSAKELLKEPEMKPITIFVKYKNDDRKNEQLKKFTIDIEPWKGMTQIGGKPPLYKIADDIHELKEILRRSISGFDVPLIRTQTEDDYQKENEKELKEAEEYFFQEEKVQNQS